MNFVDEIELKAISGSGGDGIVRWHHPKGGPAGGDGGRGGDVRIRAVRDTSLLGKYRGNTLFRASDGKGGGRNSLHGADGEDVIIDLPVGSIIKLGRGDDFELLNEGDEYVVLRGGAGGFGNEHFKSSRNVRPEESTSGKPGDKDTLDVELRLIADLGLVGFPNAGKSSLLNALTNAKAKVGNYEFTTLDPNLGNLLGYIIADIPGIIEGASEGRGLGHRFLRHISRTKVLIFCISADQDSPVSAYRALLDELVRYDPGLAETPFIIALTKTDLVERRDVNSLVVKLKQISEHVYPISIHDACSLKTLADGVISFLRSF